MLHDSHSPQDTPSVDTPIDATIGLPPANTAPAAQTPCPAHHQAAPSTHSIRRENLQKLLTAFAQQQLAAGQAAKGIEQAFAAHLQISPSMLSQIKRSRNISDALANQIERLCDRPLGWLSMSHASDKDTQTGAQTGIQSFTEDMFLTLARQAWRAADAEKRHKLRSALVKCLT